MNTAAQTLAARADDVPRLLLEVRDEGARRRHAVSAAGAAAFHVLFIALLWWMPAAPSGRPATQVLFDLRQSTPLVAPPAPFRLTQKEPQRGKPAAEVDISALLPRPALQQPQTRGSVRPFQPPPGAQDLRRGRELDFDLPQVEMAQALPPAAPHLPGMAAPEAPKPAPPKRDNPFEPVGGPPLPSAQPRIALPGSGVQETVKSVVKGAGGAGITVGDAPGSGGVSEGVVQTPRPGRPGSTLELLSDPKGVDFRPYLVQVLASVRRNWYAVMPESARLGARGRVVVQFIISRSGQVPKLVIAVPSGFDALDRAAVASISASNPFPPLPAEFGGGEIRLQLVFSYNMPR